MRLESSLLQKIETSQLKMTTELEKLRSDTTLLKAMVGFLISLQLPVLFKLYFG
ncbi:hypothetical protein CLU93_5589 [Janthinobacterium sp. 35]|nr:hypothetical protein CLU93_5589 [Janthinobacterium sp. 35]